MTKHLSLNHMSLAQCTMPFPFPQAQSTQCWNWPERTRGWGVSCRNVRNLAQGLKFEADFHSKMSVCRHKLGGGFNPPTIPTLSLPLGSNTGRTLGIHLKVTRTPDKAIQFYCPLQIGCFVFLCTSLSLVKYGFCCIFVFNLFFLFLFRMFFRIY